MLIGGSVVQANWLGPKVDSHLSLYCTHQMNWANSRNGSVMMIAP